MEPSDQSYRACPAVVGPMMRPCCADTVRRYMSIEEPFGDDRIVPRPGAALACGVCDTRIVLHTVGHGPMNEEMQFSLDLEWRAEYGPTDITPEPPVAPLSPSTEPVFTPNPVKEAEDTLRRFLSEDR